MGQVEDRDGELLWETQAGGDAGQCRWLLAPAEHSLCHLVTCVLPCGTEGSSSSLHFVLPCCSCTQHKPLLSDTCLCYVLGGLSGLWTCPGAMGSHWERPFIKCQCQKPVGSVCAQALEQGTEGFPLWAHWSGGSEDSQLWGLASCQSCRQDLWLSRDFVPAWQCAKALEKRAVVTPQSSVYGQV